MSTNIENTTCICASHNMPCDLACSKCDEDLAHILVRELGEESDDIDGVEFINHMKEHGIGPVGTCAICGKNYAYGGSPEMTKDLTRGLMQNLLTAYQHDSSNVQT